MKVIYKLTDEKVQTKGRTQWGEGVTHRAKGGHTENLCTDGWIHAYESPLLAVLLNPMHANFNPARLWEAEGEIGAREGQLKVGCRWLTTVKEIPLPVITGEQKRRFAILCALEVYHGKYFVDWANEWLSGRDRSVRAAATIREVLRRQVIVDSFYYSSYYGSYWSAYRAAISAAESVCLGVLDRFLEDPVAGAALKATHAGAVDLISIAESAVGA